jgi:hypothetical protein
MIQVYKIIYGIYHKDCTLTLLLSHDTASLGHIFNLLQMHMHIILETFL